MKTACLLLASLCLASALGAGCTRPQRVYTVYAEHHETVPGRLDAQRFRREIYDTEGVRAVELVYCPIVPNAVAVCRTAIVWARGQSELTGTTAR
jgi:hypothetical protein